MNIGLTAAGWVVAAILGGLLLRTTQQLGEAKEECNTRIAIGVAEAEKVAREAHTAALRLRLQDMDRLVQDEREARVMADMAREEAEDQANTAQATIRDLMREGDEDDAPIELACLNVNVPADALDSVR